MTHAWRYELRHQSSGTVIDRAMQFGPLARFAAAAARAQGFDKSHTFVAVYVPTGEIAARLSGGRWEQP